MTLINQNAPQAGLLVGVTNPFYDGTCKHWPHHLSLGDPSQLVSQHESNTYSGTHGSPQDETSFVRESDASPRSDTRLEDQNA